METQHMLYSKTLETPIGKILACALDAGVCLLVFVDNPDLDTELEKLQKTMQTTLQEKSNESIDLLENQLKEYFEGSRKTFTVPLCPMGTEFQKTIWTQLQNIRYGKTLSFKEQAFALGNPKALRAVAGANGANKIPILIPCYRVVGIKGNLTGYSGGLWRKRFLLDLESTQYKMNLV